MNKNLILVLISVLAIGIIVGFVLIPEGEVKQIIAVTPQMTKTNFSTNTSDPINTNSDVITAIPPIEQRPNKKSSVERTDNMTSKINRQRSPFGTNLSECSTENNMLTSLPISLDSSYEILPLGKIMGSSHITPTDHLYFNINIVDDNLVEVLSPASGYIVTLQRSSDEEGLRDYRMILEHSCTLFTYYIHLREIDPIILKETGEINPGQTVDIRIPVSSGQSIGKVGPLLSYQRIHNQTNLDFAVIDTEITLPGFIIPNHYEESWKIHTVDPFDYYEEPLRIQLLERNLRNVEPYGGKIDFDIDGKLVGNWFLDGTETYFGKGVAGKSKLEWDNIYGRNVDDCGSEYWDARGKSGGLAPCNTWIGHITFAYDSIHPDQIKISMGVLWDFEEGRPPWRVKNNTPDPASIDVKSGIIKYEIFTDFEGNIESEPFDIVGALLVQMIDDQTIKVEVFFGQRSENVNSFSEESRIYRR